MAPLWLSRYKVLGSRAHSPLFISTTSAPRPASSSGCRESVDTRESLASPVDNPDVSNAASETMSVPNVAFETCASAAQPQRVRRAAAPWAPLAQHSPSQVQLTVS